MSARNRTEDIVDASPNALEHDPEKACPALDAGWVAVFPRDKREGVCAKIMLNQRTASKYRFLVEFWI
jgi:hypothetical protein